MPGVSVVDLRVPLIRQDKKMSCWYASAQMVLGYRSPVNAAVSTSSSIDTLIRYFDNKGLQPHAVMRFGTEVGLSSGSAPTVVKQKTIGGWTKALMSYGPLWTPIMVKLGPKIGGHAVVVRGTRSDGSLWINDPAKSAPVSVDAAAFSASVYWNLPFLYKLAAGPAF